jgi:hypothetical protein
MNLDWLDRIALYVLAGVVAWQVLVFLFDWLRTVLQVLP